MVRNVNTVLARAESNIARILLIVVVLLHAGLSLLFKFKFFTYDVIKL